MASLHSFVVDRPGFRLDIYVHMNCPELSRTQAQRLIADGKITVNDHTVRSAYKLGIGDRVNVLIPPTTTVSPTFRVPV